MTKIFCSLYFFPKLQKSALVDILGVVQAKYFIFRYFNYYGELVKHDASYEHVNSSQSVCMCGGGVCICMYVLKEGERRIGDF